MTLRELRPILEELSKQLPGMVSHRDLLVFPKPDLVLRGFAFDTSSKDKKTIYPTPFFMPLYVPHSVVHFTHGSRLAGRWSADDPQLVSNLAAALRPHYEWLRLLSDANLVSDELARQRKAADRNLYVREAYAYSLVLAGRPEEAKRELSDLLVGFSATRDWEQAIQDRATLILHALQDDAATARTELIAWRTETIKNLGLEKT